MLDTALFCRRDVGKWFRIVLLTDTKGLEVKQPQSRAFGPSALRYAISAFSHTDSDLKV